jgi:hypothetical protein
MPVTLKAKMDMFLWSEVEQRVPYGRVTNYVLGLIQKDLAEQARISNATDRREL